MPRSKYANGTRSQRNLREDTYQPQPVWQVQIPRSGKAGRVSHGIPTIYDRVSQQALLNRLERIFGRYSTMPTALHPT
jgi:RNA-directed DNA polymerase